MLTRQGELSMMEQTRKDLTNVRRQNVEVTPMSRRYLLDILWEVEECLENYVLD
jgi:hypothetical protein